MPTTSDHASPACNTPVHGVHPGVALPIAAGLAINGALGPPHAAPAGGGLALPAATVRTVERVAGRTT